jgi:hypothetical protein
MKKPAKSGFLMKASVKTANQAAFLIILAFLDFLATFLTGAFLTVGVAAGAAAGAAIGAPVWPAA